MTSDTIEQIGGSLVQHGELNNRIYLMHLDPADLPGIIPRIDRMADECGYSKICAKVPASESGPFLDAGYTEEARVEGMFHGREDGVFLARYPDPDRRVVAGRESIGDVLVKALDRWGARQEIGLPSHLVCRECGPGDAEALAGLFASVFETYPFPITDPAYIRSTMESHIIRYWAIWDDSTAVAASSAEMAPEEWNVEMTDFATHLICRGYRLSSYLLGVAYTISRAESCPGGIHHLPGGVVPHQYHLLPGGIPAWRHALEQHPDLRGIREHERLVPRFVAEDMEEIPAVREAEAAFRTEFRNSGPSN